MFAFKDKHMWPFNIEKLYIWNGVDREVCGIVMGWVLIHMSKAHILRHQGPLLKQLPRRRYKEESPLSSPPLLPFPAELPHLSHVRAAGRCTPVFSSVQFSSVTRSCSTLCDPMDCSTPGFPVHHQFLELAQTHVHQVGDAIQASHPLLSPAPPQHHGLFQWVTSSHQVAKVLELQLQYQSFRWIFGLISFTIDWFDLLAVQGVFSKVFSNTTVQKHQFFGTQFSLCPNSHTRTWLLEKP